MKIILLLYLIIAILVFGILWGMLIYQSIMEKEYFRAFLFILCGWFISGVYAILWPLTLFLLAIDFDALPIRIIR